jgi:acetoin utilization protein AcuB
MRIHEIMATPVVSVEMDDMLYAVKDIFEHLHFHHLPVVENNKLQGVLSDRDLLSALSPALGTLAETEKDLRTLKRRVHQVMSRNPVFLRPEDSIQQAIALFNTHSFSCLPVVDFNEHPVGMVSWRDILKLLQRPEVELTFKDTTGAQASPSEG